MSNQILQAGRALAVIPSDNARIPYPAVVVSGENNDVVSAGQLVDPNVSFTYVGVGDVVYNITDQTAATVTQVVDANTLNLNADIFTALDCVYIIYQQSPQTGNGNQGCVLYVGSNGNVDITTTGQDNVTLVGVNKGSFIPVHVLAVRAGTTATSILALW
jgi:hypothetical protein